MLKIFSTPKNDTFPQGSVVTIGKFDGMHLGHQSLLVALCQQAKALSLPSILILFEPHPSEFFNPHHSPARLMRFREKITYLQSYALNYVYRLRFNKKCAELSPQAFIEEILIQQLNTKLLIVGQDFYFGKNRQGNLKILQAAAVQHGFEVHVSKTIIKERQPISSTLIRDLLSKGNLKKAAEYLGHPYSIIGRVQKGLKLGEYLNCKTANIPLLRKKSALHGIFVVKVKIGSLLFGGIANIGESPTVGGRKTLLEVHLFDFNQNLYGQCLEVFFLHKLRDEVNYNSLDILKKQIEIDMTQAREFLANVSLKSIENF